MKNKWENLQNGSDIRGVAISGVKGEQVNLSEEVVKKIAYTFSKWLSEKIGKSTKELKIAVGRDSRISGPVLAGAASKGLSQTGAKVLDCELASTPAMFMATKLENYKCDGSIMLTASHLPFNRNGMKFFTSKGGLNKQDISDILKQAKKLKIEPGYSQMGSIKRALLMDDYAGLFVEKIRSEVTTAQDKQYPLKGFHIIVDAGNGGGGFFVEKVLQPLGADTSGSLFLEPDGNFPNHEPNPENKQAMEALTTAVKKHKADLGIIFDTDVDRSAIVDATGQAINRNRLIALMAVIVTEQYPGATIVTDSITSDGLSDFIENTLKGKHHRFKRGYKNVIDEAIRLNKEGIQTPLAIETSGHAAMQENYFLDDGSYLIAKILIRLAEMKSRGQKNIGELIEKMPLPEESKEFRLKIKAYSYKAYGIKVIEDLRKFTNEKSGWSIVPDNYEGIRISCDANAGNGWFLLRLSLHDPVIPINVESNNKGGVATIAKGLLNFLDSYKELDTEPIKNFFNQIHK